MLEKLLEEAENVIFKEHFYDRSLDRGFTTQTILDCLKDKSKLISYEQQKTKFADERKFRLYFKLSSKYTLAVVLIVSKKNLYIITAWRDVR